MPAIQDAAHAATTPPSPQRLLKPAEAAELLSISERKLWSLANSGQVACVRIDRSVRYSVEALRDYVAACTEGGQR